MIDHEELDLALRARLETVAEIPTARAWSNVDFKALTTVNQLRAEYVPATSTLVSAPAAGGTLRDTGVYVVTLFFLANQGLSAIRAAVAGVLAAFPNGWGATLACGALHIGTPGTGAGPSAKQPIPDDKGRLRCVITIPWYLNSINSMVLS